MPGIWSIGRMRLHLPIKDEDLAFREALAKMIIGTTVAQPELKHRAWQLRYLGRREVEASALRLEPAYEAVEAAHANSSPKNSKDRSGLFWGQHRIAPMTMARSAMIWIASALIACAANATELNLAGDLVQGGLVHGRVSPNSSVSLEGRTLRLTDGGRFVFGLGRNAPASVELFVTSSTGAVQRHMIAVAPRTYQIERIDGLPPRLVTPSEADLVKIRADAALLATARQRDTARDGFAEEMIWPVVGRISGIYGSQRVLNGEPRSPHRGVDIAAPTGTPVGTMGAGVVSLAETDMYFTGGTVMVDHGHGLNSIYVHLDQMHVTVGQRLEQGQTLGTVGATGRATGPHLHWGVYWFDQAIDPALLVGAMPKNTQ